MRAHDTPAIDQEFSLSVLIGHGSSSGVVDLCSLKGRNWVRSVTIRQNIDQPVTDCEVRVSREEYELNLSPLDGASALNAVDEPLTIGHMLIVTVTDSSGDHEVFRGYVDAIDWSSPVVTIRARDLAGRLQDTFSETARMYAVGRVPYGVRLWAPSTAATAGEWIAPERLADSGATGVYNVIVGGTFDDEAPGQGGNDPWGTGTVDPDDNFDNGTVTLRRAAVGSAMWAALTDYTWGDIVMPTDSGTERAICIQAGQSSNSEPAWPSTPGAEVSELGVLRWTMLPEATDGGLSLEAVMGAIILDNVSSLPDIYHPTHSGYWRNPFVMAEQSVLEQLRQLALEIGWDLRLKYVASGVSNHELTPGADDGWGYWRLHLYEPSRSSTSADFALNASDVINVTQCGLQLGPIRNVVSVTYSEMTAGGLVQTRKTIKVTDATSITKYGRRFFGIGEGSASGINTSTEATALANAVLSDLKDPGIEFAVELPFRWWIEINDLVSFPTTYSWQPFFNSAQKLAVVAIDHRIETSGNAFRARTVIGTRGKPTAGTKAWHERGQGHGKGKSGAGFTPEGAGSVTVVAGVKGGRIKFTRPGTKVKKPRGGFQMDSSGENVQAELYMSTSSGFTPGPTNLRAISFTDEFNLAGLETGTAQYFRIGLRDRLGNLSALTPETTLTPTQAALDDLDDGMKVAVGASKNSDQSLNNAAGSYKVIFDNEYCDDGGGYDHSNSKFVAPAAGYYRFYARVDVKNFAVGDCFRLDVYKGGAKVREGVFAVAASTAQNMGVEVKAALVLAEDDEVEIYIYKTATSSVSIESDNCFQEIDRIWSR